MRKLVYGCVAVSVLLALSFAVLAQEKADPEKWVRDAEAAMKKVNDYTFIFNRQEVVKGELLPWETIETKFMKPFKIYMKWIKDPYNGREMLFVRGVNDNEIRARDTGAAGLFAVNLNPEGSLAMKGNRHPVTDAGFDNLIKLIGGELRKALKNNEFTVKEYPDEVVYGRQTQKLEGIFPKDKVIDEKGRLSFKKEFQKDPNHYYCWRAVMNLDKEYKLPIKVQVFDQNDRLIENYGFENLKLNPGLTDADFDKSTYPRLK